MDIPQHDEGILAAGTAPVYAQATKLHLLQWVDFIPEGDGELKRQVAEYNKQMKTEVTLETINRDPLVRASVATRRGHGPNGPGETNGKRKPIRYGV